MATTVMLADALEEYILYDLMVYTEWKQENEVLRPAFGQSNQVSTLSRITASTQRTRWTVLWSLGLPIQSASPCYLPPNLVKLVNSTINWHLAVSSDGSLVAIMQEQSLEIRSKHDDFATLTGRACIEHDGYPQWCHLVWSPDNTMLACSFIFGVVETYDIIGTHLSMIPDLVMTKAVLDINWWSNEDVVLLYQDTQHHGFHLEAVKLCLMACHTDMFLDAMKTLSQLPQISEDPELLNLLLKHKLVPHLVPTPHYQVIVQYVLANQQSLSESHDYSSIETLANQLRDNGFVAVCCAVQGNNFNVTDIWCCPGFCVAVVFEIGDWTL